MRKLILARPTPGGPDINVYFLAGETGEKCLSLKKVDSQQRVNNGVFTHPETVQLL